MRAAIAVGASTDAMGVSASVTLPKSGFGTVGGRVAAVGPEVLVALFPLPRPLKTTMPAMRTTARTPAAISRVRLVIGSPG